jgi:hypothetical protein
MYDGLYCHYTTSVNESQARANCRKYGLKMPYLADQAEFNRFKIVARSISYYGWVMLII